MFEVNTSGKEKLYSLEKIRLSIKYAIKKLKIVDKNAFEIKKFQNMKLYPPHYFF